MTELCRNTLAEIDYDLSMSEPSHDEVEWRRMMYDNKRKHLLSGGTINIHGEEKTLKQLVENSESSETTTLYWALSIYADRLIYRA